MTTPILAVEGLRYCYHDGTQALRGINLRLQPGEKICLAGPNGAGKSTLLQSLAGLVQPQGRVTLKGASLPRGGLADPATLGLVFQSPDDQLFCPTIGEDIAFGPRNQRLPEAEVDRRVTAMLAAVGLTGVESRSAHHLSGGEKKRAAMAAVLACQPEILALDEPWANLDARAARAVTSILCGFSGALMVASHNLARAAQVCSRLVIIDQGLVCADGPMATLRQDTALLEAHGLEA